MSDLRDLIPMLQTLNKKHQEQTEAFIAINRLLRQDGYSLYWDDNEERYCIYPLPQILDGTYQLEEERSDPSKIISRKKDYDVMLLHDEISQPVSSHLAPSLRLDVSKR